MDRINSYIDSKTDINLDEIINRNKTEHGYSWEETVAADLSNSRGKDTYGEIFRAMLADEKRNSVKYGPGIQELLGLCFWEDEAL